MSLADAGYILISTVISVSVHEFGHALAAAWSASFCFNFIVCFEFLLTIVYMFCLFII